MSRCKKTNAQFKQEVFGLVGDEYEFLEPYQGSLTKIKVKHNKCGKIYEVIPSNFLSGCRCPYCLIDSKTKTDAQFKKEVYALVGDEYTFLDTYVNDHTKIKVRHNKCGHIYKVIPNSFLRGRRCPSCFGKYKKTNVQFKKEVFDLVGNGYTFLDAYVDAMTKIRVKHNECGGVYKVAPSAFFSGNRCPYCSGKIKKTDAQFKKEVYDLVGDEYTFIEPYTTSKTKIKVRHNKCCNVYEVKPNNFFNGHRCPYCSDSFHSKKTNAQFQQEVKNLVGSEYVFIDEYVNTDTKIRVKHNKCGNVYGVRPNDFLRGYRCPYCNSPKGETLITKILNTINVDYEYQKTFSDLKDKTHLSYDFFIPNQNILIEYQGQQHYEPIDYFGGESQFKLQQKHDQLKADYAKANGYNLIAVPYTEDTFSKIKKYLLKHGLAK